MSDLYGTVEAEIAKELVKALVGGLIGLARKVPALFKRSGKDIEERVAAELESSARSLQAVSGPGLEREVIRQEAAWEMLIRTLLRDHPDAAEPLRALAAELAAASGTAGTVYQQHNSDRSAGAQGPGAAAYVYNYVPAPGGTDTGPS